MQRFAQLRGLAKKKRSGIRPDRSNAFSNSWPDGFLKEVSAATECFCSGAFVNVSNVMYLRVGISRLHPRRSNLAVLKCSRTVQHRQNVAYSNEPSRSCHKKKSVSKTFLLGRRFGHNASARLYTLLELDCLCRLLNFTCVFLAELISVPRDSRISPRVAYFTLFVRPKNSNQKRAIPSVWQALLRRTVQPASHRCLRRLGQRATCDPPEVRLRRVFS